MRTHKSNVGSCFVYVTDRCVGSNGITIVVDVARNPGRNTHSGRRMKVLVEKISAVPVATTERCKYDARFALRSLRVRVLYVHTQTSALEGREGNQG